MNEICKELRKTYNTNIINKISENERIMLKIISEYIEKKKERKGINREIYKKIKREERREVLSKLIYNHYNEKKPVNKYISGPYTCTYCEVKKKKIYVFGEYHGKKNNCEDQRRESIDITEYLKRVFKNTDVFIDFYLEIAGYRGEEYDKNIYKILERKEGYLNDLRKEFIPCIERKNREKEECKLMRIHYIDIRQTNIEENIMIYFLNVILNVGIREEIYRERKVMNWIKLLANNESEKIKRYIIKNIYEKMLEKEYKKTYMREEIERYIKRKIERYIEERIREMQSDARYIEINRDKIGLLRINNIFKNTLPIGSLIMDGYTLARIFRKFNIGEGEKDQPEEPENIIIYVGEAHANVYREFFEEIGGEIIERNININREGIEPKCLDMTGITQPIFSR